MPVMTQEPEIVKYYEFLADYEKTGLYQVAFTQSDSFAKFQVAFGHEADYVWNDGDRFSFLFNLPPVAYALNDAFNGKLRITAADAMLALLEDHSFAELRKMPPWELSKLLQNSWEKLYKILAPDFVAAPAGVA